MQAIVLVARSLSVANYIKEAYFRQKWLELLKFLSQMGAIAIFFNVNDFTALGFKVKGLFL